jgi:ribosomal-protein-alanine N-acetyltransferase
MSRIIETERLIIKTSDVVFADQLLDYYSSNRKFFDKYEPVHIDKYYTLDFQQKALQFEMNNIEKGTAEYYYVYLKEEPDKIIGSLSYCNIRRHPYFSTIFGYNLDENYQGHGYATESCKATMEDVLEHHNIHRIEARVLTDNQKSINILERLGFKKEGYEYSSIYIRNGFRDHYRYAYIVDESKIY